MLPAYLQGTIDKGCRLRENADTKKYLYSTMVYSLMTLNLGLLFIEINSFLKTFYIYTAISFSINDVLLSGRVVVAHLKGWVLQSSLQH